MRNFLACRFSRSREQKWRFMRCPNCVVCIARGASGSRLCFGSACLGFDSWSRSDADAWACGRCSEAKRSEATATARAELRALCSLFANALCPCPLTVVSSEVGWRGQVVYRGYGEPVSRVCALVVFVLAGHMSQWVRAPQNRPPAGRDGRLRDPVERLGEAGSEYELRH